MGQSIQEWTKWIFLKAVFHKIYLVLSQYLVLCLKYQNSYLLFVLQFLNNLAIPLQEK